MAKFIAISGPSSTGKSTLIQSLSTYPELSKAVFSPDLYESVWAELVDKGFFTEFSEVNKDYEYLCVYILRLLKSYEEFIDSHKNSDKIVFLDGCWLDFSIYSILNMWYTRVIKDVQENILSKVNSLSSTTSRIYLTQYDSNKEVNIPHRSKFRRYNSKLNRPLESQYYTLASNFKSSITLPSSDIHESSLFILDDLKKIGYL